MKVSIRSAGDRPAIEATAPLNSGFESEEPEMLVAATLAEALGLYPALPDGAEGVEYETAGDPITLTRIRAAATVRVLAPDRTSCEVRCGVLISPAQTEAIMNDAAISALRIVPLDPRANRWRFREEDGERPGAAPQRW